MNYKITSRYLKSKERLIAVFYKMTDAQLFLNEKISNDDRTKQKRLYRLYDEYGLIEEYKNGLIAHDELEDPETFNSACCLFTVVIQPENSLTRSTIALFNNKEDAHLFIVTKCIKESDQASRDIFMIFKGNVLITTLNKNVIENQELKELAQSGGNSKCATLSPLSRRPTPPGGPEDYWIEENDENE